MRKREVSIGKTYAATVSGRLSPVRLDSESPYGGWRATNMRTGRAIRIKSAAKLRFEVQDDGNGYRRVTS